MAIETAVMEQLLQNLLKLHQQQGKEQSVAFAKLAKAAGLDPKLIANAESKLKALGDAAEDTAKSTSKMSKAGSIVGSALADLTTGVMGTAGNLVNFGAAAMAGTAKVSDFFAAFKDLPIIGTVAGLFSGLVKLQEEALDSFTSLSSSGIDLGGSLTQLRMDAFAAGLNLQEYTKVLKENSETLVQLGGSASIGAKNFNGISKAMKDGGLLQQLLNLGFTAEQANNTILQFAKSNAGLTKQQAADHEKVAAAAFAYGKELDVLARLTGQERDSIQKKIEEETQEANFQAFLATQDQATKDKLNAQLRTAGALLGKGGTDLVKAQAQGIAVQTEEGQMTMALYSKTANIMLKETDRAMNKQVTASDFLAGNNMTLAKAQVTLANEYKAGASTFQAMALGGENLAGTTIVGANAAKLLTNAQNGQTLTVEENIKRVKEEIEASAKKAADAKTEAAEITAMNQAIKELGLELWKAMKPLMPLVHEIIQFAAKELPEAGKKIRLFIEQLFSEKGRTEIMNNIATFITELFGKIWDLVKPWWATETAMTIGKYTAGGTVAGAGIGATAGGIGAIPGAAVGSIVGLVSGITAAVIDYIQKPSAGRSAGSYGTVGTAFENFGSGTPIVAHGEEGVFTPSQINKLMAAGTENNLKELISQLNNTQAELVYQMRQVAENSRRNVQATENLSGNAFA